MAAVFDSISLQNQFAEEQAEKQRQLIEDQIKAIRKEALYVQENDFANIENQAGRRLTSEEFERRVKKLNPDIDFITRELTPQQCVGQDMPVGTRLRTMILKRGDDPRIISGYFMAPVLNEFDVIKVRSKIITNAPFDRHSKHNMITDLPRYTIEKNWDGTPNVVFEGLNNLQEEIFEPCGLVRGWRPQLAEAIVKGALTLDAVEREFDGADRATWSHKVGKQSLQIEI